MLKYLSILFIVMLVVVGCGKKKDLVKYESDLLDFDFKEYVISSEGSFEDDYANITFELDKTKIDAFKKEFSKKISALTESDLNNMAGTNIYKKITASCDAKNIKTVYQTFKSGEKSKTRDVYATLCYKDNKYYLNIIG